MKIEGTRVWGFENAVIGMRLPMSLNYEDAKSKCDSAVCADETPLKIGESDLKVMKNLIKADNLEGATGAPNSKYLRMIHVQVAVTAPMYFMTELDTYKVGTVRNSSSKMHRLASTPITMDCFEMDDFADVNVATVIMNKRLSLNTSAFYELILIPYLERIRQKYNELMEQSKKLNEDASEVKDIDKGLYEHLNLEAKKAREQATKYWKELIRLLPESWLQTSVLDLNYETLRNIYAWRKNHKLTEWHTFCDWIKTLPYAEELILNERNTNTKIYDN